MVIQTIIYVKCCADPVRLFGYILLRLFNFCLLYLFIYFCCHIRKGVSVAEWLACWTQAQKGLGSNRSRDALL